MRFFIADTHFGHSNHRGGIIKMMARVNPMGQLFSCTEEHDHFLLGQINTRIHPEDELFIIGDFAWDKPGKYRAQIQCRHVRLVKGNHDKTQACANVFGEIPEIMRTKAYSENRTDHIKLFLSHYPNAYWDGSHRGWGHLYGHCHGQREEELDMLFPQRRALDIGVDNVYRVWGYFGPVSEAQVFEYMARRGGHDEIRFYEDYQAGLYVERGLINE